MKHNKNTKVRSASAIAAIHRIEHEAEAGAFGALSGAAVGAGAGLPGTLAGAFMGVIAGMIAGGALDWESRDREARTKALDAELGVSGGDLGAPDLKHPSERRGG